MQLIDFVCTDVSDFMKFGIQKLMFNERDFQMHLAMYLKNCGHYDEIYLEYHVPVSIFEIQEYPWQSEMKLDLVVMKDKKYLPIELKYKTDEVRQSIYRFGEELKNQQIIIKNQSAPNLGMYDFWKDVYRVELVKKHFKAVKNGLTVFMTNESYYTRAANKKADYYNFNMIEGNHLREKKWLHEEKKLAKTHPGFILENAYKIK